MNVPPTILWSLYRPFVIRRLMKDYGYSKEQATAHVQDRTATAEHALSLEASRLVIGPDYIRNMVSRVEPETKVAVGAGVGILGLGLIGLVLWLWKRNKKA